MIKEYIKAKYGFKVHTVYIAEVKRELGSVREVSKKLMERRRMEDKKGGSDIVGNEILIYQTEDGRTKIDVKFEDETVWLTQAQLCELYQTSKSNISEHIKHIFEEEELDEESVVRKFRTTAADGKSYNTIHYNLDMIISLGYRVKSKIATSVGGLPND